jgi:hypothetical protein
VLHRRHPRSGRGVSIQGETDNLFEAAWKYAEFADLAGAIAPTLEISAFAMLIHTGATALQYARHLRSARVAPMMAASR